MKRIDRVLTVADFPDLDMSYAFSPETEAQLQNCKDAMGVTHYFEKAERELCERLLAKAIATYPGHAVCVQFGGLTMGAMAA